MTSSLFNLDVLAHTFSQCEFQFQLLGAGVCGRSGSTLIVKQLHLVSQVQNPAAQQLSRSCRKRSEVPVERASWKEFTIPLSDNTPSEHMFDRRAEAAPESPTSVSHQFVWELINDGGSH